MNRKRDPNWTPCFIVVTETNLLTIADGQYLYSREFVKFSDAVKFANTIRRGDGLSPPNPREAAIYKKTRG